MNDPLPRSVAWDSILLIDGDNDPHFPPDFEITERTLVRVFLREGAKAPRALERRLAGIPNCVTVFATKTAANAADFVMALHAGVLHATLPMHLPFTIVTNDKGLSVIAQEFQRVGRQTTLWTSHPERRGAAAHRPADGAAPARASRRRRGGRSGRSRRSASSSAPQAAPAPESSPIEAPAPEEALAAASQAAQDASTDLLVAHAAASYAARLSRIKDAPSRLKSLLSDIANRTQLGGVDAQNVVDELVRIGAVVIDEKGRVHRGRGPGAS